MINGGKSGAAVCDIARAQVDSGADVNEERQELQRINLFG